MTSTTDGKIEYLSCNDLQIKFFSLMKIVKIFLIIQTNTATCEKPFSYLRHLKSFLRAMA